MLPVLLYMLVLLVGTAKILATIYQCLLHFLPHLPIFTAFTGFLCGDTGILLILGKFTVGKKKIVVNLLSVKKIFVVNLL